MVDYFRVGAPQLEGDRTSAPSNGRSFHVRLSGNLLDQLFGSELFET